MEHGSPGSERRASELSRVPEVYRTDGRGDYCRLNVHPVHGANGEAVGVITFEERPRPLGAQVGAGVPDEGVVANRQASVSVIVAPDHVVTLGEVVPDNLLIAPRHLAHTVVHGRVPLHLLPRSLSATGLYESQRDPATGVGSVAVAVAVENRWVGGVSEDASADGERDRCVSQPVAEDASLPVGCVMDLVINEERLLVASEVAP